MRTVQLVSVTTYLLLNGTDCTETMSVSSEQMYFNRTVHMGDRQVQISLVWFSLRAVNEP